MVTKTHHSARKSNFKRIDLVVLLIALVTMIVTIAFVATAQPKIVDFGNQKTIRISIGKDGLSPSHIVISKGATVTWTNNDSVTHSVMRQHEYDTHKHAATARSSVDPDVFSSPELKPGESYSFIFNDVDSTKYHDPLNPSITGKITIN